MVSYYYANFIRKTHRTVFLSQKFDFKNVVTVLRSVKVSENVTIR